MTLFSWSEHSSVQLTIDSVMAEADVFNARALQYIIIPDDAPCIQ